MKSLIRSGKGGWVAQFEGEGEFHVFRGDEALRLVKTLCKKSLGIEFDTLMRERQGEIVVARMKADRP